MFVGFYKDKEKIAAAQLDCEQLAQQYVELLSWVYDSDKETVSSKFSLGMAWFRELHWEMVRRKHETVH